MYNTIFATRFKLTCCGILCLITAFSIFLTFKPHHLHLLSLFGDAIRSPLSIHSVEDTIVKHKVKNLQAVEKTLVPNLISELKVPLVDKPLCRVLSSNTDYCEMEGDIRIQSNSSTIFVVSSNSSIYDPKNSSWTIQPYPRKGTGYVKHWTVKIITSNTNIHKCTQSHNIPALLFSTGGYAGNHFHDFADIIFPLYWTSSHFKKEVRFLASDYRPKWIGKYPEILSRLSKYEIVNIDGEKEQVHCYKKMVAGLLKYGDNKELMMDQSTLENEASGESMQNFRKLLRQTYSLERVSISRKSLSIRPRLLIVSRKKSRILSNEGEVSQMAQKLGFEVILAEAEVPTRLSTFARLVNSCDVMLGIHGAGLTNMLFLPDNAILIQIIPLGHIDIFARLDFGNPAPGMTLRYLQYEITLNESSLSRQYPIDHPVLRDPMSIHRQGWGVLRRIYLKNQNVTLDIHRFKGTLVKALKILRGRL